MKRRTNWLLATPFVLLALLLHSVGALADDTDIYVAQNSSLPPEGAPKVMLTIDWRPNVLNSEKCLGDECNFLYDEGYLKENEDGKPVTFFTMLRAILRRVLDNISGVEVGLMISHQENNNCRGPQTSKKCSNGGYILKGFTPVDQLDAPGGFYDRLAAIPDDIDDNGHTYQGAEIFFEFFRYLTGQAVHNAHNGWNDYDSDGNENLDKYRQGSLIWDTNIEDPSGTTYISPLTSGGGCGSNIYTINFLFNVSQQDYDAAIELSPAQGGLGVTLRGKDAPQDPVVAVLGRLQEADLADGTWGTASDLIGKQNVTSYFITDQVNTKTDSFAKAGGTGHAWPLNSDPLELAEDIEDIFEQILSVSTTFVSGSLPVDAFNRVDVIDDVYLAIFRADPEGRPFWNGNLKKLRLVENDAGFPTLVDAEGDLAINALDGRINREALTFWTDPSKVVPPPPDDEQSDWTAGHDGRATNQGGAGSNIPGFDPFDDTLYLFSDPDLPPPGMTNGSSGARILFTEASPTSPTANGFMPLNADAATAETLLIEDDRLFQSIVNPECIGECTEFGNSDTASKEQAIDRMIQLLAFSRGWTTLDGENYRKRAWFMGDPLHSRPRPVNYGGPNPDTQDVRILMTTNGGFLHMFDADFDFDQDSTIENWAFMPRDVMPTLDRLENNNKGPQPIHPYTIDSTVTTLVVDGNHDNQISTDEPTDRAIAVVGMRRGGKHYYAIDIQDPDNPKFLWRVGPDLDEFGELGQSWSIPTTVAVPLDLDGDPDQRDWAFIFGGGYNGDDYGDDVVDDGESHFGKDERDEDVYFEDTTSANDKEGNAIYIVNALTGDLIWKAKGPDADTTGFSNGSVTHVNTDGRDYFRFEHEDMLDGIAADVSVFSHFADSFDDRAYVGDTGGQIWRIDFLHGDFPEGDPRHCDLGDPRQCWSITRLFSAGRHVTTPPTTLDDRRFLHAVDIATASDSLGEYVAVVAASGNRAHPLSTDTQDFLYMIKDRPSTPADLEHADLPDLTDNCLQNEGCTDQPDLTNGWKMGLVVCPEDFVPPEGQMCGEKGLSKPTTFLGVIRLTTYVPPDTSGLNLSCEPSEGTGTSYAITLNDATAVFNRSFSNDQGGVTLDRFARLASGGIPSDIIRVGVSSKGQSIWMTPDHQFELDADLSYLRTYWYQEVMK